MEKIIPFNIPIKNSFVTILPNDHTILRTAELTGTPLQVEYLNKQREKETLLANATVAVFFIIFLIIIFNKSMKIANKSLNFLAGKSSFVDPSSLNTRFQDIAAIPEAIEEIKEIVSFLKDGFHLQKQLKPQSHTPEKRIALGLFQCDLMCEED